MAEELTLEAAVLTAGGSWLELEDPANGLRLHSESFSSREVRHRTQMADGVWVDGSFAQRATRENVTEQVSVWIDGEGSAFLYATRAKAVKDAFNQLSFSFRVRFGDLQETWVCPAPSDYTESTDQPLRFATMGTLRFQVMHLPDVTLEEVA